MTRPLLTWLLCLLLGITWVMPTVAMSAVHHAGEPCLVETEYSPAATLATVDTLGEHDGLSTCCASCGSCAATLAQAGDLTERAVLPRLSAAASWPLAPPARLDRPPRV
jgi:hypothetical protein